MRQKVEIHMHWIDKLAILNGFVSGAALWPQIFKIIFIQSTYGVSAWTMLIIFLNSLVWLMYALHRGLISLGIASFFNASASLLILLLLGVY